MLLFVILYVGFVAYLFIGWNYLKHQPKKRSASIQAAATIILPVRNEGATIKKVLEDLQNQENRNFQLVVVDDFSTDNTMTIVRSFLQQSFLNAELIELNQLLSADKSTTNNKKTAIAEAVKRSTGDFIVCIDGDVQLTTGWFQSMLHYYQFYDVVFFSAQVLYTTQYGFFSRFLEVDQINNMAVTNATYNWKKPTMANGANMAFAKSAWYKVGGFDGIMEQASGDDMMLLHRMTKFFPNQIGLNADEKAIAITDLPAGFSAFVHQRVRWFGKVFYYEQQSAIVFLMAGVLLNMFIAYHCFSFVFHPMASSVVLLIKILLDAMFLVGPLYRYKREKYIVYLPVFSLIFSMYIASIALIAPFVKYKWKSS